MLLLAGKYEYRSYNTEAILNASISWHMKLYYKN
jgi:hypothetical protein